MTRVQLLDKTEVRVQGIALRDADLPALARAAAGTLSLPPECVFVTDVRDRQIVFDILVASVDLEQVVGKERALLQALAALDGVTLETNASVHSSGVLGVIGAPQARVAAILEEAGRVEKSLRDYVSRRVAVVSTGGELMDGHVKDTNLEAVREVLGGMGYEVEYGGVVGDDKASIAGRVARLATEGYGIIITTGGVGAEEKDCTVEALELLDHAPATAVLASYTPGQGRHVKPSVRIAVARVGLGIAVALPGPTHEVRLALTALAQGLRSGLSGAELVEAIAAPLRAILPVGHRHAVSLK